MLQPLTTCNNPPTLNPCGNPVFTAVSSHIHSVPITRYVLSAGQYPDDQSLNGIIPSFVDTPLLATSHALPAAGNLLHLTLPPEGSEVGFDLVNYYPIPRVF